MNKFIVFGLGNVGLEYTNTRHNIGFGVLDFFSEKENALFEEVKYGYMARFKKKGRQVLLIKPNTYMNLSGKAVRYWMQKEKVQLQNILVVTDDIHLPFTKIRLRKSGSSAGHNGLGNIETILGTEQYNRVKVGIGSDFSKGKQVDFVLGEWTEQEKAQLKNIGERTEKMILDFILLGADKAMNLNNS